MAEFSFSEEEEDNAVVRVFAREESPGTSPSVSDDGELEGADNYQRQKSSSKAKLRVLPSKTAVSKPHRSKDEEIEASLNQLKGQGKYVKLNVGGSLFYTTIGTLTKHDNMLRAMFSERIPLETDEDGECMRERRVVFFIEL